VLSAWTRAEDATVQCDATPAAAASAKM